jgi:BirA family biotin operon repressor/biotin-[acetyl-CoA-carboxylase] ligase
LHETVEKNGVKYLIVGIGMNLVKNPNIKGYATTNLYELTKTKINVNKMSKELIFIYKNFLKSQKVF